MPIGLTPADDGQEDHVEESGLTPLQIEVLQEFADAQDRASCLRRVIIPKGGSLSGRVFRASGRTQRESPYGCGSPYMFKGSRSGNFTPMDRRIDIVDRLCHCEPLRSIARATGVIHRTALCMRLDMGHGAALLLEKYGYDREVWAAIHANQIHARDKMVDIWGRPQSGPARPRSAASIEAELALVAAYRIFVHKPFGDDDGRGSFALCDRRIDLVWNIDEFVRQIIWEIDKVVLSNRGGEATTR